MRLPRFVLLAGMITALTGTAFAQTPVPNPKGVVLAPGGYDPDRHIEVPGQGAQDPARAEVLEGRSRDMPRCLATLLARRENANEAREVCDKILHDLGE